MATLPMFQVDAFAERVFEGNPAAVCPLDGPIPDALMQDIAAEMNLSETAFFYRDDSRGDVFRLRWFTPTVEVELCGHATLASAFVLFTELEPARREVRFQTRGGLLVVKRGDDGELVMDFPALPVAPATSQTWALTEAALGQEAVEVLEGSTRLLAVLASADDVRRAVPDLAAVARTGSSLCITAPGEGQRVGEDELRSSELIAGGAGPFEGPGQIDFVSRYFAPASGVPEDPVTGSAHCMLAPYWGSRLAKTALRARQLSRRGGDVVCTLAGDRVLLGGKACLVLRGTLMY
jgi:predicted PhzF superfamily epimerase YddE/YHI9